MKNQSGQTVQGYELLERIGAGGFGAVYRAYQSTVGREVAVKVILPTFANNPDFIRSFEMEAQLIARLEHLHIVPLYDHWRDPDGAYIVMRWLRGGSLGGAIREGAFSLEPASNLLDQVAAGLTAAHSQQVIHRDLKPSNILLDEDGNAYLADFGIARDQRGRNGKELHADGEIAGSLAYMTPEQARGEETTAQSDIYSLGVTLYEMLAGRHPFPGLTTVEQLFKHINEPLPEIAFLDSSATADMSAGLNEVIQKATAKNPKHRYQDALSMAVAFRDAAKLSKDSQTIDLVESLTRREQEILRLIVEGNSNKQIAQTLYVELSTVKWHVNRIYKKLGVRSRVQAIVRARELDLIISTEEFELKSEDGASTHISIVLQKPVNPYKGLRSFEPADNRDFFGREVMVEQLLVRLRGSSPGRVTHNPAKRNGERFLAIVGPSGSGKSSLVKAGLIPALWSGKLPNSENWFIIDMVPGAQPLDDLEIALTRIAADQANNLRGHLDRDAHGLARAAGLILPNDDSELVIVLDQFEELYTLVEDESVRIHFMELIQGAVSDPRSRVRVIITLRADYYDRPLQYPEFGKLVRNHIETLLPLSAEELERAMVNPAGQAGVTFEAGLVATIIEEVNYRPGALPLLQYALTELFEQRQDRLLTGEAYTAIGGAAGALAKRAEELYQEHGREGKEAIRQMFLRLVTVGDTLASVDGPVAPDTRRRVPRSELLSATSDPERLDEIIDTYAAYRLLSLDHHPSTRRPTVEVAHEAMLREWDRLRGWLEESQTDLSLHRQLIRATGEWLAAGGDESFLLRGSRLTQFESWADETQLLLTEEERSYLDASLALREERAVAEIERQEQAARLEQRASRRLKALVAVMAVALVVAIGLTIAALSFARQVEEQQHLAEEIERLDFARELASAAQVNLDTDPELAALLALEAADTTYLVDGTVLPEVEDLLHRAVKADFVRLSIGIGGEIVYSPDGKIVAIGNETGTLNLYDVATGEALWTFATHHRPSISDIAFSPDGRFLATSSRDLPIKVRIWDAAVGKKIGEIKNEDGINSLTFSPDGQKLLTGGVSGDVRIWDLAAVIDHGPEDDRSVGIMESSLILKVPGEVGVVAYSPDDQRLAILIPGQSIIVLDPNSGEQLLGITDVSDFATGIAFSPDGNFLAGSSGDLAATVWDARTGEEILTVRESWTISDVAFSPDGRTLGTATENGKATLWDVGTGLELLRLSGHASKINSISFSLNGQQVATSSWGENARIGATRIWDINLGDGELFTVAAHEGKVHDAVYNADGTKIASAGEDGAVKVWDSANGTLLHILPGQKDWVHFPAFSPDGQRLAAVNQEGGVSIWDANSGQQLLSLRGDAPAYTAITFSPDGSRLAAGGQAGIVHIWDATTGERLTNIHSDGDTIMELIYTHDGEQIRSYDWAGLEVAWDAVTGEHLGEDGADRIIWDVELAADGQLAALACSQARVFSTQDKPEDDQVLYMLENESEEVTGVAFNPDGTILATSASSGAAKLWDMDTGQELMTLSDSTESLAGVDISPDGRFLVTAGADGTVSTYAMSIEELMDVVRSRLSRDFTHEECRNYLHQSSCREE